MTLEGPTFSSTPSDCSLCGPDHDDEPACGLPARVERSGEDPGVIRVVSA
jgi:hypothetical protein